MKNEIQALLVAAQFAAEKHAKQRRKGAAAEPYLNHLIEVAQLVSTAASEPDSNLVIAALLHDSIEDAGVPAAELSERFGEDVTGLVLEVTGDKPPAKHERKLLVEHPPAVSERAQLIKLADKISNLRSILFSPTTDWSSERKHEYVTWAKSVVEGLTSPNPALLLEFETIVKRFEEPAAAPAATRSKPPGDQRDHEGWRKYWAEIRP